MSGDQSFLFEEKVGLMESIEDRHAFFDAEVTIRMAQNGFKLHYQNKDFVAKTLKGALELTKEWFEDMAKKASDSNTGHEDN